MSTSPSKNLGGCPTLEQQASNRHTDAEIRVDLEMGKMTLKVIKHLAKMVNKIETYKENTQLTIIDKVLKSNKDYMKAKAELDSQAVPKAQDSEVAYEEEDYEIALSLTSEDQHSTLN